MSVTPNLGLTLPAGSDWADVSVLNGNWETVDQKVLQAIAAAAAYDAGKTYKKGDYCTRGGLLYQANQDIVQPEIWTAGHWSVIYITDVIRGLTAADVGAAPEGYGLGSFALRTAAPDYDLDNIDGCGWFVGIPAIEGFSFGFSLVSHIRLSSDSAQQTAYLSPETSGPASYNSVIRRFKTKNVWGPWEWVNPTMRIGMEYRTTERWSDKPVYAKYVNFGNAPNATAKSVAHDIENFFQCAGWSGILGGANLQGHSGITAVDINATSITITTDKDLSASQIYVAVKYTKTTD